MMEQRSNIGLLATFGHLEESFPIMLCLGRSRRVDISKLFSGISKHRGGWVFESVALVFQAIRFKKRNSSASPTRREENISAVERNKNTSTPPIGPQLASSRHMVPNLKISCVWPYVFVRSWYIHRDWILDFNLEKWPFVTITTVVSIPNLDQKYLNRTQNWHAEA